MRIINSDFDVNVCLTHSIKDGAGHGWNVLNVFNINP